MGAFLEVAQTGLVALLLHPRRSLATAGCLVTLLTPYLAGLGLSRGVEAEAEEAVENGADLYVSGAQFGRPAPVPLEVAGQVRRLDGVKTVTPRVVGLVELGKEGEPAVLVGLPPEHFPAGLTCVEGRLPRGGGGPHELVLGTELARRLKLRVGSYLPPFYRNDRGERVSEVVGLFRAEVSLWQSRLVLTTLEAAQRIFDQEGLATDLLVSCRPGYAEEVRAAALQSLRWPARQGSGQVRARVTSRDELRALLPGGLLQREGVFTLHFVLAFAAGVGVLLVTSGFGLSERRREVGILKATGWQTDEVLLRGAAESLSLALAGTALSVLLAFGWLRGLNGYWIASVFLSGVGRAPSFPVPFRLGVVPVLLALLLALALVLSGTLYSTWRAATAAPREAMR